MEGFKDLITQLEETDIVTTLCSTPIMQGNYNTKYKVYYIVIEQFAYCYYFLKLN
jgi:hypothetical protein